ncbi:MAG: GNAT family N-acetyltransferase [Pseudohongiellaceae bacterium]
MTFRPYNAKLDKAASRRIWREIGWIDYDDKDDEKYLHTFLASSDVMVAEIDGHAECLVAAENGSIRHLEKDLPLNIIAAVTTSHIARKQGFASHLTAQLIAAAAEKGAAVSALGMFEQGFYSRLGFGTGPYEHTVSFEPARIKSRVRARVPLRIGIKDYKDCHNALMNRWRGHGSVQVFPAKSFKAEMGWTEQGFGLGYRDSNGCLSHFFWGSTKGEHGPYKITAIAYQNRDQLLELMALIKGLGDQVYTVEMNEPAFVQLQDMIASPFRGQARSENSEHEEYNSAEAYWQIRINDVLECIAQTCLANRSTLSFNLTLTDPIDQYLDKSQAWQGVAGQYTVHLGPNSEAKRGVQQGLPTLTASVGAFSRLWLGAASANSIATADELTASQQLLDQLDVTLALPLPKVGWDF